MQFYEKISAGYNRFVSTADNLELVLIIEDVNFILNSFHAKIDVWYLDGFSPSKNPEMWTNDIFSFMKRNSKMDASFSTYTTASIVKKGLAEIGFVIERIKGFGNKRHMLKGKMPITQQNITHKPWFRLPKFKYNSKKAVIIGAGLAGSSLSYNLTQKGFSVTIIERDEKPANGASGNPGGMFAPVLTSDLSDISEWSILAYKEFLNFLNSQKSIFPKFFTETGVFQIVNTPDEYEKMHKGFKNSILQKEDAIFINKKNEILEGFDGIFFPKSGWIKLPELIKTYLELSNPKIDLKLSTTLTELKKENNLWKLILSNGEILESEIVIFANSFEANSFIQCVDNIKKVRGQILFYPAKDFPTQIKTIILYDEGYLIPNVGEINIVGSTFDPHDFSHEVSFEQNQNLLLKLQKIFPEINLENSVKLNGRVSFRAMTNDHLPVVGHVPNTKAFHTEYDDLWKSNIYKNYKDGEYLQGLYVSSGHGSKGILNSFLAAKLITSMITEETININPNLLEKINPARFLIQKIINRV